MTVDQWNSCCDRFIPSNSGPVEADEVVAERFDVARGVLEFVPAACITCSEGPCTAGPGTGVRDESKMLLETSCRGNTFFPQLVADLVHETSERHDPNSVHQSRTSGRHIPRV